MKQATLPIFPEPDINLMQGDCREVMAGFDDNCIDLTVTSPPYDNLRTYNDSLVWGWDVFTEIADQLYRVTKKGGVVVWVVGDATIKGSETGTSFRQALYFKEIGFNIHDTMIYGKINIGMYDPRNMRYKSAFEYMFVLSKGKPSTYNPIKDKPTRNAGRMLSRSNGRTIKGKIRKAKRPAIIQSGFQDRFNIWQYYTGNNLSTKDVVAFKAPAIFPEKLAHDHIISWSNEGDTVLDPMMGSGTTGKMAKMLNRNFIGIEKDAKYFEIAQERI
jgi:DNA modification methylase